MYLCENCKGTFEHFKTPGMCPLCNVWASVRCEACKFTADANQFINNHDACPKCGAKVSIPGAGSSSGCFVATVAFADPYAVEVCVLRSYRNRILSRTRAGRVMIAAYYRLGPGMASIVSRSRSLKWVTRAVLKVVVKHCERVLEKKAK